jgi:hypothetical protein
MDSSNTYCRDKRFNIHIGWAASGRNCNINIRNLDSSVGIATGYGLDGPASIPGRGKIFLFSTTCRPALGPTQPPIQWAPGTLYPRIKRPGRKADHSPPSSAEVKNGGAIPPLPHMSSWHSVWLIKHRDNFTFYIRRAGSEAWNTIINFKGEALLNDI